nr:MAG TPA_asm: hypothetical protein [Inoviridae sp.]
MIIRRRLTLSFTNAKFQGGDRQSITFLLYKNKHSLSPL